MTFKRFNASEAQNYDQTALEPGTLTWDSDNGLRIHDGSTSGGNTVGGGGSADTGYTRFIGTGIGSYDTNENTSYDMTIAPNWDGEFTGHVYVNLPSNDNYSNPLQIVHNSDGGVQIITKNNATWTFDQNGNLTLPVNGDIKDSNGTSVLGGGSSSPAGAGSVGYSDVWVNSSKADSFWTTYTLTGDITMLFNYGGQPVADITLSSQEVSGKQFNAGDKILVLNDASSLNSKTYGMVVEFPSNATVGDTFAVPVLSPTTTVTLGVSQMQPGQTYTIASVGTTTNWGSIGIFNPAIGQQFTYQYQAGFLTGDATVNGFGPAGVAKLIFKPASGHRAVMYNQNGTSSVTTFGEGSSVIAGYLDLSSGMGQQALTWVYAGSIDSIPTWYQMWF
jgi:hypothetical protein